MNTGRSLEVAGADGTTTGTLHHLTVVLTLGLAQHPLHDVLVGAPIPETDDGGTDEHHEAGILMIHRIAFLPVEHMGGAIAVVQLAAVGHHVRPSLRDAAVAQGGQAEEQHEERADDQDRRLNGRHGHHALHATEDGEHCRDKDQAQGTVPEGNAQQILKEDTTGESRDADLGQHISHQRDDAQPRTSGLGVAELQKLRHRDDAAQLIVEQLIERHEEPAEDEDHPALHLPMGHAHTVLCSGTGQTNEVLRADVGGKDSSTDHPPGLTLTKEVVLTVGSLHFLLVFHDAQVHGNSHQHNADDQDYPVEPDEFFSVPIHCCLNVY